jgi:hypothetical protein
VNRQTSNAMSLMFAIVRMTGYREVISRGQTFNAGPEGGLGNAPISSKSVSG